ncbi:MAG: SRPBCC family protein [Acidimicrobiales bacterium]
MANTPLSTKDTESVERVIPAPASAIFDLLADPARHHEIDGSGTVQQAKEGSHRVKLGDRFGMDMKMGIPYAMVNEIIEFEDDRRIAWQTTSPIKVLGLVIGGRIWRYELEPVEGGTRVRETWDISKERIPALVRPMRAKTREGMAKTLARIEEITTSA